MKKYFLIITAILLFTIVNAQDTIRVGNLVIVKPVKDSITENTFTTKNKVVIS